MTTNRGERFEILRVTQLQAGEGAVKLVFEGGLTAAFPADHPDRDHFVREVEYSIRHGQPVGIGLDRAGNIVDLHHTTDVLVELVREDKEDPDRLAVGFWGFCAVCYLVRDHPDFERIRDTLKEAATTRRRLWFANYSWPEQSGTEIWNRIMDVRPVPVPVDAPPVVAAAPGTADGGQDGAHSGDKKPGGVSTAAGK